MNGERIGAFKKNKEKIPTSKKLALREKLKRNVLRELQERMKADFKKER